MCALESIRLYMGGSIGKGKHAGMHGTDIWSVGDKGIVLWICHKEAQMSMVSTTKVRMDGNGIGFQFKLHLVQ